MFSEIALENSLPAPIPPSASIKEFAGSRASLGRNFIKFCKAYDKST
jgi:hypothetical protein